MFRLGRFQVQSVVRLAPQGAYLGNEDDEVLLPRAEVPDGTEVGDELRVFVLTDSEDRMVATLREPLATAGTFASLRVVDDNQHGVFMDIGLDKDLFVPWKLQYLRMAPGEGHVVWVDVDERTNRLVGSSKLASHFEYDVTSYKPGAKVELLVYAFNDVGAQVVVDGRHAGILYANECPRRPALGEALDGWVARVRDDNRLDVSMIPVGRGARFDAQVELVRALMDADGFLPLTDKSDPALISRTVGMSKKAFKRAVGNLYRSRRLAMEDGGIRLLQSG